MKYMQVSGNNRDHGLCSDDACPCGSPGATIPRGEGYIYISKEVAQFRADCLTEAEAQAKIQMMSARMGAVIFAGSGVFSPVLVCEQGARKRGLDLEVAAADAKHWWETGLVPVRPTPLAGGTTTGPERAGTPEEVPDEVFGKVREALVGALGVDEEEVTPEATLTGDLGAESIDFLDIVFRLEK